MVEGKPRSNRRLKTLVKVLACLIVGLILAAILFPVTATDDRSAPRTIQLSHIKQVALSMLMYAGDYDNKLPPAMSSNDELRRYGLAYVNSASLFTSINPDGGAILGNGLLAGQKTGDIASPANAVMVYDSRPWVDRAVFCDASGGGHWNVTFEKMLQQLTLNPSAGKKD